MKKIQELLLLCDKNGIITSKLAKKKFSAKSRNYANCLISAARKEGLIENISRGVWKKVEKTKTRIEANKKSLPILFLTHEERKIFDLIFEIKSKKIKDEVRFIEKDMIFLIEAKGLNPSSWISLKLKLSNLDIIKPRCIASNGQVYILNENSFVEYNDDSTELIKIIVDERKVVDKIDNIAKEFSQKSQRIDELIQSRTKVSERMKEIDIEKDKLEKELCVLESELNSIDASKIVSAKETVESLVNLPTSSLKLLLKIVAEEA